MLIDTVFEMDRARNVLLEIRASTVKLKSKHFGIV
tara:strand:- start:156 stop:260 length:105 start_codon:yes stop_codon:yes gene_type:complete